MTTMNILLIISLAVASGMDWKYRKIPNWLTLSMIFTGFILQILMHGTNGIFQSLFGLMTGIALLYLPFSLGGVGGGDVKLMGAIGAFVGPMNTVYVFLASAIIGGFFSMIESIRQKAFKQTFNSLKNRLLYMVFTRKLVSESEMKFNSNPIHIPYALSLGAGYLCAYFILGGI